MSSSEPVIFSRFLRDEARYKRDSPRSLEEVELCLAAIRDIFNYLDGGDRIALYNAKNKLISCMIKTCEVKRSVSYTSATSSAHGQDQPLQSGERLSERAQSEGPKPDSSLLKT
jgi:hypothetical protein